MKLFPHAMIRIGGGTFDKMETLNITDSTRTIDEIFSLKEKLDTLKQTLSDELYSIIPELKDSTLQNLLVKMKRDIFNGRDLRDEKINMIEDYLSAPLVRQIRDYCRFREEIEDLWKHGEAHFDEEVATAREQLKTLAADHNLRKGLLLGSQSLYKRLPSYIGNNDKMKKKDFQVERGLIKYFSRMHGKTSPFSTFTNLAVGNITPDPEPPSKEGRIFPLLHVTADQPPKVVYHIRLNNFLYDYLKTLLTKNHNIYRHLLLRPNPTIQKNEEFFLYLTNSSNIEAFQRIPANPALDIFLILSSQKKEGIVYRELIQTIIDNEYIDAPAETLEDFINQLIDFGFLEYDLGVSGIDPDWDHELIRKLNHLREDIPLINELLETLQKVRTLAETYGQSNCRERTRLLNDAFEKFKEICMKLHEDAGLPAEERKSPEEIRKMQEEKRKETWEAPEEPKSPPEHGDDENEDGQKEDQPFRKISRTFFNFSPEKMFYEDTSLDIRPQLDENHMREFSCLLHDLLQRTLHFEGYFDERSKMLHYFINKYGKDASIDLLTFYEDYYREYKKPEAQRQEALKTKENKEGKEGEEEKLPELPLIPAIEKKQKENRAWLDRLKTQLRKSINEDGFDKIETADTVKISSLDLDHAGPLPDRVQRQNETDCSFGCFVQFYVDKDAEGNKKLMGVLNASFPGFGKMFSRFLHIFPIAVTEDIRAWNRSLMKEDRIFLEDSDASFFNANLHPPLMPNEIHMPNGQNSLPPDQQIPITELKVKIDATGTRLQLLHVPTGKQAYVFDLGFQGHRGRSQLFQLLEKFTLAQYLYPQPLVTAVNGLRPAAEKEETEIEINPRIVYGDHLVLQRKSWYVPESHLPRREPGESDWAWFYRINEWRRKHGMPDDVFIFVAARSNRPNSPAGPAKRVSPDDYKPQYISFKNPFLVNILEKAISRVPGTLKIAEMLPDPNQLQTIAGSKYVMEFVLQWYTGECEAVSDE
jgi:hypothetical protein